jgi:protocatechuate 3,4-dioxygenase beta subunit
MENKTQLYFVTEIGTFGDMAMKDPTVQAVEQRKDLQSLMESTNDPHLKKYLQNQLNK